MTAPGTGTGLHDGAPACPGCGRTVSHGLRECPFCGAALERRPTASRPGSRRARFREALGAYAFLAPNTLGFLIFTLLPVIAAFFLSFTQWDAVRPITSAREVKQMWVGTRHYTDILGFRHDESGKLRPNDERFWQYCYNTAFMMLGIPLGMALSLFAALCMNQKLRGIVVFRTIYFIPSICSAVAVAMLWRWLYNPDFGLINDALRALHLVSASGGLLNAPLEALHLKQAGQPITWIADPLWAKPALIAMGLWVGVGGQNCILYLAGLQGVPQELYEAAEIDGAGGWQKLRYITWPMLAPTTFFILIMSIIYGFQSGFVGIHILTRGGPAGATTNLLYYIYNHAFEWFKMGRAAALSMILFVVVFTFTLINWKFGRKGVEYL